MAAAAAATIHPAVTIAFPMSRPNPGPILFSLRQRLAALPDAEQEQQYARCDEDDGMDFCEYHFESSHFHQTMP